MKEETVRLSETPTGIQRIAENLGKRKGQKKVWQNFQLDLELRDSVAQYADAKDINLSKFFRKCAELLMTANSTEDALKNITLHAREITFKKRRKKVV